MPKITLLQKIYGASIPKDFQETLNVLFKGLKVKANICGVASRDWLRVEISGEDQKFAIKYLGKNFGLCPESIENLTKLSTLCGRIVHLEKSEHELYIDIGVFYPKIIDARLPIQNLQAQLINGKKLALKKIVELFGFKENFPISVKILEIAPEKEKIIVTLSEKQVSLFSKWRKMLLDRLLIFGSPLPTVTRAVKKSGFYRNIIKVETLGFLEHAIICKLGTQAAGLIPKIGRLIPHASLTIFSPTRIRTITETA
jgi:hypothetical protein